MEYIMTSVRRRSRRKTQSYGGTQIRKLETKLNKLRRRQRDEVCEKIIQQFHRTFVILAKVKFQDSHRITTKVMPLNPIIRAWLEKLIKETEAAIQSFPYRRSLIFN
jgi:predicted glycoside hydrolase/deacetylase ChbG (UPF0249 family)